jgi:DNA-binding transcriptional LysR family regulator
MSRVGDFPGSYFKSALPLRSSSYATDLRSDFSFHEKSLGASLPARFAPPARVAACKRKAITAYAERAVEVQVAQPWAHTALARGELIEVLTDAQVPTEATMTIFYPHRAGLAPRVRVLVDHLLEVFAHDPSLHSPVKRKRA